MREVIFDTETTGLDPADGHRIIQIGALEIIDLIPTGRDFMTLIDPEREIDEGAARIHGITTEKLAGAPKFAEIVDDFFSFIGDAPLVAHNAEFDRRFLNAELERLGREPLPGERFVDTLEIARAKFPGQKNSLDVLCRRFGIDNSMRTLHDALLDCRILAEVYLELKGGRQAGLGLDVQTKDEGPHDRGVSPTAPLATIAHQTEPRKYHAPRPHAPSAAEEEAHRRFLETLSDPLWRRLEAES
ncbi:MAG: DNA polymerase III subunit epsilon [Alphaproteobacteria bacterium]|nr:MAG: DNA polymerase III subunit epsilon [Alphaproteobacteria bacterium]